MKNDKFQQKALVQLMILSAHPTKSDVLNPYGDHNLTIHLIIKQ